MFSDAKSFLSRFLLLQIKTGWRGGRVLVAGSKFIIARNFPGYIAGVDFTLAMVQEVWACRVF